MKVMLGDTIELGGRWKKFEVTLDETDLDRIFYEHEVAKPDTLKDSDAFLILSNQASQFVLYEAVKAGGLTSDEYAQGLETLREKMTMLLTKVTTRD